LASRGIAFALDAAVINAVAIGVSVGASLILSLFHLPSTLKAVLLAIGGFAYIAWSAGYFIVFWSTAGQTPGGRVMRFKVITKSGARPGFRRGVVRCVGLVLAALPLFAGYLLIIFDRKCRGLQDRMAGTLVVDAPADSLAVRRREAARAQSKQARATKAQGSSDLGDAAAPGTSEA
jgi:uncharacterized RDD family membrane protein YckC